MSGYQEEAKSEFVLSAKVHIGTKKEVIEETDKAYMAGIIDGEGSLTIVKRVNRDTRRPYHPDYYTIDITVVSSTFDLVGWIKSIFGGQVDRIDNKHNHIWRWKILTKDALTFLLEIRPFLHLKGKQADLLIKYLKEYRNFSNGRKRVSPENILLRDNLYWELRNLHTRNGRPRNVNRNNS